MIALAPAALSALLYLGHWVERYVQDVTEPADAPEPETT